MYGGSGASPVHFFNQTKKMTTGQTVKRLVTNDGFLLLEDSKEPMTGKSAYYELTPTGREQNLVFEGVPRKVPSKPLVRDIPVRYVYVNRNGDMVKNWYRDLRQIFKTEDGEATPVNGRYRDWETRF